MMSTIRRMREDESGFGLILVIGVSAFVTILISTAAVIAVHGLGQSQQRTKFEQSLATAENGIDFTLARLQRAFNKYNADYPIPSVPTSVQPTPVCNAAAITQPTNLTTAALESAWVRIQFAAMPSACWQTGGTGEFLILKPSTPLVNGAYPKYGKIYALGVSPNRSTPGAVTRLVKAEYLFQPYRPTHAVLTGGNITIDSSTTVTAAAGIDPALAAVHTNGQVTSIQGNPSVSGPVSSSVASSGGSNNFAANPGGTVISKETQSVPTVSAASFYYQASSWAGAAANWFDLCSDGKGRTYSTSGPCTGTVVGSSPVRGWGYSSGSNLWTASTSIQPGTYYVDGADVTTGSGNPSFTNLTVIAAAKTPDSCSTKLYGNINWDRYNIDAPSYPNVFLFADSDIATGSNFKAGSGISTPPVVSGMFIAGDQIQLETSSSGAVGSVVGADQCNNSPLVSTNQIKNPAVYYDPNSTAPFTSIITTTLWLEYN